MALHCHVNNVFTRFIIMQDNENWAKPDYSIKIVEAGGPSLGSHSVSFCSRRMLAVHICLCGTNQGLDSLATSCNNLLWLSHAVCISHKLSSRVTQVHAQAVSTDLKVCTSLLSASITVLPMWTQSAAVVEADIPQL